MKTTRLLFFIATLLLGAITSVPVNAYERSIKAEWTRYTPPTGATTASFKLYQDGTLACTFPGAAIVSGDCTVNITKLNTPFTLSALFTDGKESAQSAPFNLIDYGPGPEGLKVTVVTVRAVIGLTSTGKPIMRKPPTITQREAKDGEIVKEGTTGYRDKRTGEWISITTFIAMR